MSRFRAPSGLAPAILAALAAGCTTAPPPPPPLDLGATRAAVEAARRESASEQARAFVVRAEEHLSAAEALGASEKTDERRRAEALGTLAQTEAEAASTLEKVVRERPGVSEPAARPSEAEREKAWKARLAKAVEEQKRLEEKVALLQKDLEATETEVIRTKAKLKGIETKAEASSAIAEARILMLRVLDEKSRSAAVARAQEKLDRAERQLREGNYGAAVFFALQAQDLLDQARRAGGEGTRKK